MIFDTNLHVTVDDTWDQKIRHNSFKNIINIHKKNKLIFV